MKKEQLERAQKLIPEIKWSEQAISALESLTDDSFIYVEYAVSAPHCGIIPVPTKEVRATIIALLLSGHKTLKALLEKELEEL